MTPSLPWHQAFFTERRLTSKLKHLVLQRYVREFAYYLGSAYTTVYYVDGFAGPGEYRHSSGTIEKGSPLLIAELAQKIRSTQTRFQVKCLNVEEKRSNYSSLESATAAYKPEIVEKNFDGEFVKILPKILTRLASSPAFVFIDPFGTKGIPFVALLPLFQRTATTEVLITLHTDGIGKKAGYFQSTDDPDPRKAQLARKMTKNLADALNLSWEELRTWWDECITRGRSGTAAFENRVLHHYLGILRGPNTRFTLTKAFPVFYYRSDEPPGKETPICFYLVFATRNKKGLYEMNDAMADALDAFYREEYQHTLIQLFIEIDRTKDMEALQREILVRFATKRFTIDHVKQRLMQNTTLVIKASDYRKAVLTLHRQGKLRKLDPQSGGITNEGTHFVVTS